MKTKNQTIEYRSKLRLLWSQPVILLTGMIGLALTIMLFLYTLSIAEHMALREFVKKSSASTANLQKTLDQVQMDIGSLKRFFECSSMRVRARTTMVPRPVW